MREVDGAGSTKQVEARPSGRRRPVDARWPFVTLLAGLVACVTTWSPPPQPYHRTAPVPDATEMAGADECEVCHEDVAGHALGPEYHADCETCHGPGLLHTDTEEITDIRFPANADCAACHQKGKARHAGWSLSEHERSGVICADCHQIHAREPLFLRGGANPQSYVVQNATASTKLCVGCHAEVASRLTLPSHHPVKEGMLDCADCHQPHDGRRTLLGARTALCTGCHEDHAGPWIYEHAPVTEDCGYCHQPHGTSAVNLLETNQPGVCISCHTVAQSGAAHEPSAWATRCTDCHGAIHGSYADSHLRR